MLTENQLLRFSRHLNLGEFGKEGQEKLLNSKVLVIGAGGLGSPAIFYLAAMGIGYIGIADGDIVDISNLQRQIIHSTHDIGNKKTESAKEKVKALNPDININVYNQFVDKTNIREIIKGYDFVIDATDNFKSKFLVNDICYEESIAFSHAGVSQYGGQTMTVVPPESGCLRCVFDEPLNTNTDNSILGSVPGIMGSIQATEAVKYLLGIGELLTNNLLVFDIRDMYFRKVSFESRKDCPVCGK